MPLCRLESSLQGTFWAVTDSHESHVHTLAVYFAVWAPGALPRGLRSRPGRVRRGPARGHGDGEAVVVPGYGQGPRRADVRPALDTSPGDGGSRVELRGQGRGSPPGASEPGGPVEGKSAAQRAGSRLLASCAPCSPSCVRGAPRPPLSTFLSAGASATLGSLSSLGRW